MRKVWNQKFFLFYIFLLFLFFHAFLVIAATSWWGTLASASSLLLLLHCSIRETFFNIFESIGSQLSFRCRENFALHVFCFPQVGSVSSVVFPLAMTIAIAMREQQFHSCFYAHLTTLAIKRDESLQSLTKVHMWSHWKRNSCRKCDGW